MDKEVICIIHFSPIEKYPPVVNFLRYIASQTDDGSVIQVLTMRPEAGKELVDIDKVQIHRVITWNPELARLKRLNLYIKFYWLCTRFLFRHKPELVLYYETLSAAGPLLYKRIYKKHCRLFVHYHEYSSNEDYKRGMVINRWLHEWEKKMYPAMSWISHTNKTRLQLFLADVNSSRPLATYLLPNYPFRSWFDKAKNIKRNNDPRIGFVHVGALSLEMMHTREMAQFVASHQDKCYWHIYTNNYSKDALEFLQSLKAPNIVFKGAIAYDALPLTLPKYDVGVILYSGAILNYIYNEPNKFFEFLSAGLNVWYAPGLKGLHPYAQSSAKPWVRCVEFDRLSLPAVEDGYRIEMLPEQAYAAENVYQPLWEIMQKG